MFQIIRFGGGEKMIRRNSKGISTIIFIVCIILAIIISAIVSTIIVTQFAVATSVPDETEATGGGQALDNMHPYTTLRAIICVTGLYPSRNGVSSSSMEPSIARVSLISMESFIGEIAWVAFDFAPRGWAFCDGQLLSIAQYQALFSLIGTTYGGDGRTTFALPDLRGRSSLHAGEGSGLTNRVIGEQGGVETVTITTNEMPSHTHDITTTP